MEELIDVVLLGFMVMVAVAAIRLRDLFAVAMLSGIYSFLAAGLFMALDAVDVAFTEAAVGAGVTTVLFLSSLRCINRFEAVEAESIQARRWLPIVVVLITGGALIYGMSDAPLLGQADAPVHGHVSQRYIEQEASEVGVPNMVTAVLASYRGFDTLGETVVIFTAGLTVLLLLGFDDKPVQHLGRNSLGHHLVLRVVIKTLLPFILMFALYVQFHGDFGAGGGFQAGVIFATGFILYDLVFGGDDTRLVVPIRCLIWGACSGVLFFAGVGVVTALLGEAYLDYNALSQDPIAGQHLGILLVEFGVGLTVFSVVLLIYEALAGRRCRPCQSP